MTVSPQLDEQVNTRRLMLICMVRDRCLLREVCARWSLVPASVLFGLADPMVSKNMA